MRQMEQEQAAPAALSAGELRKIDAYWRAANYLSVGQIYLYDNPLLTEPLKLEHIKPRLLGHWGTTPGLNFIYVHCNRVIKANDLDMIYIAGPGHGGPGMVANTYLEGTYSEIYPEHPAERRGHASACSSSFRFPAAFRATSRRKRPARSTKAASLGYSLLHAYGAVFDNPDLLVVLRDRRRRSRNRRAGHKLAFEQVPQSGARRRGHPDPAPERIQDRRTPPCWRACREEELDGAARAATATSRISWKATTRSTMHQLMAATMDDVLARFARFSEARARGRRDGAARWPMIVLRTPKGWTGPKVVDGMPVEGTFRSHQVPLDRLRRQARAHRDAGRVDAQLPAGRAVRR